MTRGLELLQAPQMMPKGGELMQPHGLLMNAGYYENLRDSIGLCLGVTFLAAILLSFAARSKWGRK